MVSENRQGRESRQWKEVRCFRAVSTPLPDLFYSWEEAGMWQNLAPIVANEKKPCTLSLKPHRQMSGARDCKGGRRVGLVRRRRPRSELVKKQKGIGMVIKQEESGRHFPRKSVEEKARLPLCRYQQPQFQNNHYVGFQPWKFTQNHPRTPT